MSRLNDLDARWVPLGGHWLRAQLDGLHSGRQAIGDRGRAGLGRIRATRLTDLVRLDDRYARGGLLGFIRDVPQVGYLAIALVLAGGALSALRIDAGRQQSTASRIVDSANPTGTMAGRRSACGLAYSVAGTAYVGPTNGQPVGAYVGSRLGLLARCLRRPPAARALALVSLSASLSPEVAAAVLTGYDISAVYVVLPGSAQPRVISVAGRGQAALGAALDQLATAFAADASGQVSFASTITSDDPSQLAFKQDALSAANQDEALAQLLRSGCACVYAVLVEGTFAAQGRLAHRSEVRLVDLAPIGATAVGIAARPLLPDEVVTVSTVPAPTAFAPGGR